MRRIECDSRSFIVEECFAIEAKKQCVCFSFVVAAVYSVSSRNRGQLRSSQATKFSILHEAKIGVSIVKPTHTRMIDDVRSRVDV